MTSDVSLVLSPYFSPGKGQFRQTDHSHCSRGKHKRPRSQTHGAGTMEGFLQSHELKATHSSYGMESDGCKKSPCQQEMR